MEVRVGKMNVFKRIASIFNFRRITKIIRIFHNEGVGGAIYHISVYLDKMFGFRNNKNDFDLSEIKNHVNLEQYRTIRFSKIEDPLVSIVIPAFNQFEYTYNCLYHIKKYVSNLKYEIVLADDCSTDFTKFAEQVFEGVIVLHNNKNLQFLKNCNNACENVRGKYILFLNNDTQVQERWLEELVKLMEFQEDIGIVGSKLIYSDGFVQEAGGIVWKDGSVYQFGNRKNADDSMLNIVRETDYISAASLLIRKKLWEDIGGFDERFVPAYYEDVDLAFEVRKRNYKVVYAPKSSVVHFEGISEKLDENQIKQIEKNRLKFVDKWETVLKKHHYSNYQYFKAVQDIKNRYISICENR